MRSPARRVVRCCYLGMFIQALVINILPLLFIPLHDEFGLSFERIGRLVLVNFTTQMIVDLLCAALVDRMRPKPLIVAANALAAAGLWVFGFGPGFFADPYHALILGTVVLSIGCGLLEVLLSPLVNALPSKNRSASMALLHAFYPIGKVVVILVTGLALYLGGAACWPWILAAWSVLPLINSVAFARMELPALADPERRESPRDLLGRPRMLLFLTAMILAGATELTIAQWTSAFVEKALGYSKVVADLAGFCLFGAGMVVGRLWFGLRCGHGDLTRVMWISAALSGCACLGMALLPHPALALLATVLSGVFVSMLWPGGISLAAAGFPLAGASLFALLAAAGDGGAALMPWLAGVITDRAGGDDPGAGLKAAYLVTALWPFLLVPVILALGGSGDREKENRRMGDLPD